jgi:hypothetical protein
MGVGDDLGLLNLFYRLIFVRLGGDGDGGKGLGAAELEAGVLTERGDVGLEVRWLLGVRG